MHGNSIAMDFYYSMCILLVQLQAVFQHKINGNLILKRT
jgi:hypothetical protein